MAHIDINGPEDYKKYVHTTPEGNVWLDKRNNSICLTKLLEAKWTHISPDKLWSVRNTRSGIHSNRTSKSQVPPTLDTPTSPIPPNQNIYRHFVQEVLDDPHIPKGLVNTALGHIPSHLPNLNNLFSPNKHSNSESGHWVSQHAVGSSDISHIVSPCTTKSSGNAHLGTPQASSSSDSQHNQQQIQIKLPPNKLFSIWLWTMLNP